MSTTSPDDERPRATQNPNGDALDNLPRDALDDLPREELVAQLRIMREALPHAVYICDLRTLSLEYLNRHVGVGLGYTRAELEAMGGLPMAIIHPDDVKKLPGLFARWEHEVPNGVLEAEMRIRARDGSWRWFQTRDAVLERDADGRVVRIVGTTNDITDRKTAERQNLSALRLDAMGHVAGHLAHDYNNLLAILQGQLALALDNVWEPEHVRSVIEDARGTAEKAAVLTRRLLGFAHQQVARSESVDLQDLLNEASPPRKSVSSQKDQLRVNGDAAHLRQSHSAPRAAGPTGQRCLRGRDLGRDSLRSKRAPRLSAPYDDVGVRAQRRLGALAHRRASPQ